MYVLLGLYIGQSEMELLGLTLKWISLYLQIVLPAHCAIVHCKHHLFPPLIAFVTPICLLSCSCYGKVRVRVTYIL